MKKILSILICAVLVTSFASSPLKASANTAQNEQLISLLMQMVTMLQAQLAVLLGQSHQTNAVIPVIYSVTPSTAFIGSTIDISGYFYNRSANCQTNGCIMAQHSDVSIKNSVGQSQVLLSETLNGGDGEIIKLAIPSSKPCVATPKGDCFPGAYVITPGQYSLTVTTDGIVSNSVPLTIVSGVQQVSSNTCKSEVDGMPIITSLSSTSGPVGTVLEINGCGLTGFEGDLNVYFEKEDGTKFLLTDTSGDFRKTGGKLIKVTVKEPCQKGETIYGAYSGIASVCNSPKMTSGVYKVYTTPWNKKSNVVTFTVTP